MHPIDTCFCVLAGLALVLGGCSAPTEGTTAADAGPLSWEEHTMARAHDANLSEERRSRYRKDAEKLAVRYINNRDSTQTEIPPELVNLLYNGMIHVVNADLPEANEATNPDYKVHALTPPQPRAVVVYVDTTAPWLDAWRDSTTQTGNGDIDELLSRFDFSLSEYQQFESSDTGIAKLRSDRPINGYAVGRLFESLEYVKRAGPEQVTDGSDISVLFFDNYLRYAFVYRWGDCPSGCINQHAWHFKVYEDGRVAFIKEEGSPLPKN